MQKMNSFHRWIECDAYAASDPFAQRVSENCFVFGLGQARYVAFDLHSTDREALEADCKVHRARNEAAIAQRLRDEEQERKLKREAAERKEEDAKRRILYQVWSLSSFKVSRQLFNK